MIYVECQKCGETVGRGSQHACPPDHKLPVKCVCGGKTKRASIGISDISYWINCCGCGLGGPITEDRDEAVSLWNKTQHDLKNYNKFVEVLKKIRGKPTTECDGVVRSRILLDAAEAATLATNALTDLPEVV